MGEKWRIVIAEDHTILREGLCALLSSDSNFEIAGEAADGLEAVACAEKLIPDLLLMDLSMPKISGIEAIKEIKKRYPTIRVIALTVHKNEEYIIAALQAGAEGYVLKNATHDELVMAIKNVMKGKPYFSPGVSAKVTDGYLAGKESIIAWEILSRREREVLKLIAEGYKNKEIAEGLSISIKTVEKHRDSLMKKLDLHNTAALTVYAMDKGLVDVSALLKQRK